MDPISVVSTAIGIVKFIVEWKKQYGAATESVKTLGATIDVVHAALISLDPIRHPQLNTPLQALVECLNETKDILVTHTTKATKFGKIKKIAFPSSVVKRMDELEGTIIKLVNIMNLAVSAQTLSVTTNYHDATLSPKNNTHQPNYNSPPPPYNPNAYGPNNGPINPYYNPAPPPMQSAADFFVHEETKRFWSDCFGTTVYSTTWDGLERALSTRYVGFVNPMLLATLQIQIDNLRTGTVTCHRLSEFCGPHPLSAKLQEISKSGGFRSGEWHGFYEYSNGMRETTMMDVTMIANSVSGSGSDGVGPFIIKGSYDSNSMSVSWQKMYTGKHTVFYSGKLDSTSTIRGNWNIGKGYMGGTFAIQFTKPK